MSMQATLGASATKMKERLFSQGAQSEIKIISHSNIFYWWPAWAVGFLTAFLSYLQGITIDIEPGVVDRIHVSNNPGVFFIAVIVLLVVFTTTKLRGIYSAITLVTMAFFAVLFAWFGWWDAILRTIPHLSARANTGFYLLFSSTLLTVWLVAFFIFDRLTIWRVRPGQLTEENLIGGRARSFDTNGVVFEKRGQDIFHDIVLGLGSGDLSLTTGGTNKETIYISNVLLVDRKVRAIERLITVKPEVVRIA